MNVDNISGIGPKNQKILEKIGMVTVDDILSYYPYRYDFIKIGYTLKAGDTPREVEAAE